MDKWTTEDRLEVTEAMAKDLPGYLAGEELYRNMAVQTPSGLEHPVLTLGALMDNLQALQTAAPDLSPEQRQRLTAVESKVDHDRNAMPSQWAAMLRREIRATLDSWKWYLDDVAAKQSARDNYRAEVHNRTRLDLLLSALGPDPAADEYRSSLAELDRRLRSVWRTGPYLGPRGAESRYPQDKAWWLYGRPGAL